jgi:hypothetical protein
VQHIPQFSKYLVSGIEIMKSGYKQVNENNCLKIYEGDELAATGTYYPGVGLIQMDEFIRVNPDCNLSVEL